MAKEIDFDLKEEVKKAFQEGIYADTPANRKLGRVGMSYKDYNKKKTESDKEEHISKLIEKTETLKKLGGFKLDRVIKYTGFDIDLKKPEAEKRKELAKKYFESASIEELADNSDIAAQADYMDQIIEDALEESVPYNAVPKRDFSKLSSTNLMKELNKEDNWKSGALNINGKTYYKNQDGKFYTIEEPKKGMTKEELFESVQKHLDDSIKTTPTEEKVRRKKGINLTKQAFYVKAAKDVKKERINAAIEADTDFDVLKNGNGELHLIDRTKSDNESFTFDMKDMPLSEVLKEIKGENGTKVTKKSEEVWNEKTLSKKIHNEGKFKSKGNGVYEADIEGIGGAQLLANDGVLDPEKKGYEVQIWDKDYNIQPKRYAKNISEAKNLVIDELIKLNVGKK